MSQKAPKFPQRPILLARSRQEGENVNSQEIIKQYMYENNLKAISIYKAYGLCNQADKISPLEDRRIRNNRIEYEKLEKIISSIPLNQQVYGIGVFDLWI